MGLIPSYIIEKIRAVDILPIAKELIPGLKRKGAQYWALSPFKAENTPSFTVHPGKGFYKCHATQKGGRVISLVMEVKAYSYIEAVKWIANQQGIEIIEDEQEKQKEQARQELRHKAAQGLEFYKKSRGKEFTAFCNDRGIKIDTADLFEMGWGPTTVEDKLSERVIFPIWDSYGRPIAFGGRTLKDKSIEPIKYRNSSESEIYKKEKVLYAWHLARAAASGAGFVILTEGYTDVISVYQAGFKNVTATCGTALTSAHAQQLSAITNEVLILRDGDKAGRAAALRDIPLLLSEGIEPYIIELPEGQDPDSYIRQHGPKGFQQLLDDSRQLWLRYIVTNYKASTGSLNSFTGEYELSPAKRRELIFEVAEYIKKVKGEILRDEYIKEASGLLNTPVSKLRKAMGLDAQIGSKTNGFKRTWKDWESLVTNFDLPEVSYFEATDRGAIKISYPNIDGGSYKVRENKKSVEAQRITSDHGSPNAIFIPPLLLLNDEHDNRYASTDTIYLCQDELTATLLSFLGLPALGLPHPSAFLRNKGQKELTALLIKILDKYEIKRIVYLLPGQAWQLPLEPGQETDYNSLSTYFSFILISLNIALSAYDLHSYVIHASPGQPWQQEDLWIEQLAEQLQDQGESIVEEIEKAFEGNSERLKALDTTFTRASKFEELLYIDSPQRFYDLHADNLPSSFRFSGKQYEVDIATGAVKLVKGEGSDPDVKAESGAYYSRQRNGGWKEISNFTIDCILEIKADDPYNLYEVQSRDTGAKVVTVIPDRCFTDRSKFTLEVRKLKGIKGSFKGSTQDCLEILEQAIAKAPEAEPLDHQLGLFSPTQKGKDPFWVWGNGISTITGEFLPVNEMGLVSYQGQTYFLPAFSTIRTTSSENHRSKYSRELKFRYRESGYTFPQWLKMFLDVHGDNGHAAFFYLCLAVNRDIVIEKYNERIPLLFFLGPKNAGKGTLQESISALFGELMVLNLNGDTTGAAYRSHFAQYRNAFTVVNEVNPSSVPSWMITGLKSAYDNQTRLRMKGARTKEIDYGEISSSIICMGQESSIYLEEAVSTRCLIIECNKEKYTAEEKDKYEDLRQVEVTEGLGHILHEIIEQRQLIADQIAVTAKALQTKLREAVDIIYSSQLVDGRLFYNWAVTLAPAWILITEGKLDYPLTPAQLLSYAASKITGQARSMISKGVLELLFDFIGAYYNDRMWDLEYCVFEDREQGHINMNLKHLAPKFQRYLRSIGAQIENTSQADLKRRLKAHPAFIPGPTGGVHKKAQLGYQKDKETGKYIRTFSIREGQYGAEKVWGPGKKYSSSAYVFDAKTLGLELPRVYYPWDDPNEPDLGDYTYGSEDVPEVLDKSPF